MIEFYDLSDNLLTAFAAQVLSASAITFTVRVDCRSGFFLTAETVSEVVVEARHNGMGSWTDIVASPFDLSAFDGTRQNFEIRLTAEETAVILYRQIKLKLSR